MYFLSLGGPWRSLVGPSDGLGIAWGAFAASLGALVTSRGVLGGSLRGPWGSWSCSCEALGGRQGILGGILGVLVRSLGVPGGSSAAPWATWWETWGPICYAHRRFSVSHYSLLNVSLRVLGTYLGAHKHRKSRILRVLAYLGASLLGAMRLQGSPWETPWATRWEC